MASPRNSIATESFIEDDFLDAMAVVGSGFVVFLPNASLDDLKRKALSNPERSKVFMSAQVKIGKWRSDFIVSAYGESPFYPVTYAIECDGAEFHSTPAQMDRDHRKEFDLRGHLVRTIRFSGKRIRRDPYACAYQALASVGFDLRCHETEDGHQPPAQSMNVPLIKVLKNAYYKYERAGL